MPRFWAISCGMASYAEEMWSQWKENHHVTVGYNCMVSLEGLEGEELVKAVSNAIPDNTSAARRLLIQFAEDINIGDFVIARVGLSKLLGIGQIKSGIRFSETDLVYGHRQLREVEWLHTVKHAHEPLILENRFALRSSVECLYVQSNSLLDDPLHAERAEPFATRDSLRVAEISKKLACYDSDGYRCYLGSDFYTYVSGAHHFHGEYWWFDSFHAFLESLMENSLSAWKCSEESQNAVKKIIDSHLEKTTINNDAFIKALNEYLQENSDYEYEIMFYGTFEDLCTSDDEYSKEERKDFREDRSDEYSEHDPTRKIANSEVSNFSKYLDYFSTT